MSGVHDTIELRCGQIISDSYMRENQHVVIVPVPAPDATVERVAKVLHGDTPMERWRDTDSSDKLWYYEEARRVLAALAP